MSLPLKNWPKENINFLGRYSYLPDFGNTDENVAPPYGKQMIEENLWHSDWELGSGIGQAWSGFLSLLLVFWHWESYPQWGDPYVGNGS